MPYNCKLFIGVNRVVKSNEFIKAQIFSGKHLNSLRCQLIFLVEYSVAPNALFVLNGFTCVSFLIKMFAGAKQFFILSEHYN